MQTPRLWHNPRCSKSRQALALLEENKVEFETFLYLKEPLSKTMIEELLQKLGKKPIEAMRTKEALFKELNLAEANDETLIQAMVENPVLVERPLLEKADSAVIGRPPERVLS